MIIQPEVIYSVLTERFIFESNKSFWAYHEMKDVI